MPTASVEFCRGLKKCELHAHLNGSIRISSLQEFLSAAQQREPWREDLKGLQVKHLKSRTLDECFEFFGKYSVAPRPLGVPLPSCVDIIYKVVTSPSQITRIMIETLEDFTADNVAYAEIRTTPRHDIMDAEEYIEACVKGIQEFERINHRSNRAASKHCPTAARLLLSIGRSFTLTVAMETVRLAEKYAKSCGNYVVGVDVSGNPKKGEFATFLPALEKARKAGLPVSVHCGEVHNPFEVDQILKFKPDRLGHALIMDKSHLSTLERNNIPIEVCPTGNMITLELDNLRQHPVLARCLRQGYPISLNTDDSVLFGTTLSEEYFRVSSAFLLSKQDVKRLACRAWNDIFDRPFLVQFRRTNHSPAAL